MRKHLYQVWGIAAVRARAVAHCSYFNIAFNPDKNADSATRTRTRARAARECFYNASVNAGHSHHFPFDD